MSRWQTNGVAMKCYLFSLFIICDHSTRLFHSVYLQFVWFIHLSIYSFCLFTLLYPSPGIMSFNSTIQMQYAQFFHRAHSLVFAHFSIPPINPLIHSFQPAHSKWFLCSHSVQCLVVEDNKADLYSVEEKVVMPFRQANVPMPRNQAQLDHVTMANVRQSGWHQSGVR